MVTERPDNPEEIFACTPPSLLRSVSHAMRVFGYPCQIQSVCLQRSKHRDALLWEENKQTEVVKVMVAFHWHCLHKSCFESGGRHH